MLNIIKVNTHEFKVSEHLAHREAFSKYVFFTTHVVLLETLKKERTPCAAEVFYRVNRFCNFISYHIFAHLPCSCMALFLATSALLHMLDLLFLKICSLLSKKENLY